MARGMLIATLLAHAPSVFAVAGIGGDDGCDQQLFGPGFAPAGLCPRCWEVGTPVEIDTDGEHFGEQMNAAECAAAAEAAGATAWY